MQFASPNRFRRGRWFSLLAVLILISPFYLVPALTGKIFFYVFRSSFYEQWAPFREFMAHSYRAGFFPLWNPYIFGGMPFWAYAHTMATYPLYIILLAPPSPYGYYAFSLAHAAIMAGSLLLLLHRLGFSPLLCFLGSLSLTATALVQGTMDWESLAVIALLPVIIYAGLRFLETAGKKPLLFLISALAVFFLIGDVEAEIYNLLCAGVFLAAVRAPSRRREKRNLAVGAALAAGALLSAVMWVPLLEYMPHSIRAGGASFSAFQAYHSRLSSGWGGWSPLAWFHPFASPLGWFPIGFAVYHAARSRDRGGRFLFTAAALAFLYINCPIEAVDRLLYRLPLLKFFLSREKMLSGMVLLWGYLCLRGLQDFIRRRNRGEFLALALIAGGFSGVIFFVQRERALLLPLVPGLLALGYLMRRGGRPITERAVSWFLVGLVLTSTHYPQTLITGKRDRLSERTVLPMQEAARRWDTSSRFLCATDYGIGDPILISQIGMIVEWPEIFGWNRVPPLRYMDLIVRIDPTAITYEQGKIKHMGYVVSQVKDNFLRGENWPLRDLLNLKYVFNHNLPLKGLSPYFVSWLLDYREYPRRVVWDQWRDLLVTETPLDFELLVRPGMTLAFALAFDACPECARELPFQVSVRADGTPLLETTESLDCPWGGPGVSKPFTVDLSSVAGAPRKITVAVSSPFRERLQGLRLYQIKILNPGQPLQSVAGGYFELYENREVLPPWFLVNRAALFPDSKHLLDRLAGASREELASVAFLLDHPANRLLQDWLGQAPPVPLPGPAMVKSLEQKPDRARFSVRSPARALLFLSRNSLPGWVCKVNGEEKPIYQADWAFTAVPVDSRTRVLELSYQPWGFRLGLWITLTSLLFPAVLILSNLKKAREAIRE